ncbi:MAG: hypothetical protein KGL40_05705 [Rhodocyclaceae bacterium]|nr:hypothetical protein [Rhodocyclaceae bacterium]
MNRTMHLNGKMVASAAIATAALGALGALAYVCKKKYDRSHLGPGNSLPAYPDTTAMEGMENIEPGEISPKVDMATDPANQN